MVIHQISVKIVDRMDRRYSLMKRYLLPSIIRVRFLWITLSLVTVTTMILVACGGGGTTAQSTPTSAPATATTAPTATSQPSPTSSSPSTVAKVQIVEKNGMYSFEPSTLTIKKGTQVIWTNASDAPHTVTSDTGAFNTASSLSQNQTFMMTFTTAGTYAYHCNIHT